MQEITFNYGTSGMHRPDRSLLFYGFVEPQARPLLCAQDLPPGYPVESLADPPYDGAGGRRALPVLLGRGAPRALTS